MIQESLILPLDSGLIFLNMIANQGNKDVIDNVAIKELINTNTKSDRENIMDLATMYFNTESQSKGVRFLKDYVFDIYGKSEKEFEFDEEFLQNEFYPVNNEFSYRNLFLYDKKQVLEELLLQWHELNIKTQSQWIMFALLSLDKDILFHVDKIVSNQEWDEFCSNFQGEELDYIWNLMEINILNIHQFNKSTGQNTSYVADFFQFVGSNLKLKNLFSEKLNTENFASFNDYIEIISKE